MGMGFFDGTLRMPDWFKTDSKGFVETHGDRGADPCAPAQDYISIKTKIGNEVVGSPLREERGMG